MALQQIVRKVFGTQNERELKTIYPIVAQINAFEPQIKALTDSQLQAKTPEFKERLKNGETLDALLPEAFAVVREAAWRVIGQRHYDVQLIGGITLHRGRIAEMKTGEGKTLVATLACYLNALTGKGVHVITVNDYLARRDSAWMGKVYGFLGLSTGIIVHGLTDRERKQNYACDISYGTNNEFGFDYLRDNMKFRLEDYVQRELNFAIIDEVDSILIDEARTPLIISGPTDDSTDLYQRIDEQLRVGGGLQKDVDYTIDEKSKTAALTEAGVDKMEARLKISNLYDPSHIEILHHVNQGLRAHVLFHRDVDYVVRDGEVMIVDEFTGRLMPGRRWSDGLHQAIETKEGVDVENENQTLATITFQNYFRMYNKLSGMTGTADTEATEFKQIYKLEVTVIPTNRKISRTDHADLIFKSQAAKFKSVVEEIKRLHEKGQPVLVGTVSVEKSEYLAQLLKAEGVRHNVLNAKQHQREAEIVAQAGRKGAITISTNMAGRGTDILLGGNPENMAKNEVGPIRPASGDTATAEEIAAHTALLKETEARLAEQCSKEREEVRALGGLFILGTERHESRRIDNQLRGRAGRQGDPGESRFYLSFEDELLRIFGQNELLKRTVAAMEDDVPIEHKWTTKAIENAQKKVEGHNYDIRKHLLEYDDVMNQQRKVVYSMRKEVLSREANTADGQSHTYRDLIFSMVAEVAHNIGQEFFPNGRLKKENGQSQLSEQELNNAILTTFQVHSTVSENEIQPFNDVGLEKVIQNLAEKAFEAKQAELSEEVFTQIQKMVLLTTIDQLWKDHLLAMDHLREGIGLQGYGQKDPLIAYKKEGFRFFQMMMDQVYGDVVRKLFAVQLEKGASFENPHDEFEEPQLDYRNAGLPTPEAAQKIQYNLAPDGSLIPATQQTGSPSGNRPEQNIRDLKAELDSQMAKKASPNNNWVLNAGPNRGSQPSGGAVATAGRNDPCPCGSGKKYKKCHGA